VLVSGQTVRQKACSKSRAGSDKLSARGQCSSVTRNSSELKQTDLKRLRKIPPQNHDKLDNIDNSTTVIIFFYLLY
jgi:hypothetical protein